MKIIRSTDLESTGNEVVEHFADTGAKIKVEILEGTEVLIEGDASSLEFLANYIFAYINGHEHARNINPGGAGSELFKDGSTHGLYFHILPCRHGHAD